MTQREEKATQPTERLVLKRVVFTKQELVASKKGHAGEGLALPDGSIEAWVPVRNELAKHGPVGEVRVFTGKSKKDCIEQYAGKNGERRPGDYRAPSLRSWRGGHGWEVPDKPKPEQRVFD